MNILNHIPIMRVFLILSLLLLIEGCKPVSEAFDPNSVEVVNATREANNYLCNNSLSFDSFNYSADANNNMNNIIAVLTKYPNAKITVNGFCDDIGSEAMNKSLSLKRAKTVKNYLISRGINPKRIRIRGYGEDSPFVPNDSDENRAKNRKVICSIHLTKEDLADAKNRTSPRVAVEMGEIK